MLMKTLTRTLLCVGAISLTRVFGLAAAVADSPLVARSVQVDISDLDLARAHDVRVLDRRLEKAARTVCGPEPYLVTPDRPGYPGYETCYRQTLKEARLRIAAFTGNARHIREAAKAISP